jgi:hypothetical protein
MTVNTIAAPAVRTRACPLCDTPPGRSCQPKPDGDHLARYLDAYTAGQLTKAYMVKALGELVVIDACAVVPAQPSALACHYCGRDGQALAPCCDRDEHRHQLACADVAGCRDYLLEQLHGGAR